MCVCAVYVSRGTSWVCGVMGVLFSVWCISVRQVCGVVVPGVRGCVECVYVGVNVGVMFLWSMECVHVCDAGCMHVCVWCVGVIFVVCGTCIAGLVCGMCEVCVCVCVCVWLICACVVCIVRLFVHLLHACSNYHMGCVLYGAGWGMGVFHICMCVVGRMHVRGVCMSMLCGVHVGVLYSAMCVCE